MHIDTGHRRNNFDFLRIAAALMVLFGHSFALSGREAAEPLVAATGLGGFGELGVSIFFVISGFLVTASYDRLPNVAAYMAARILRIIPALAVAVVLSAFVLGPLVTSLPGRAYFASAQTWLYPLRNVLLYPVTYALPGVFAGNPYPGAVNGSLWTLRLEFTCYLVVPLLDAVGLLHRRSLLALAAVAGLAYVALLALGPEHMPAMALIGARNGFLFMAGAALYAWRDVAWLRSWTTVAGAALVFAAAAVSEAIAPYVSMLALPLLVVAFALKPLPGLSSWSRGGDYSYGVYIYAFPVQQVWIQALGPVGIWTLTALTVLCVAPLAAASWLLVEKPALDLKGRLRGGLARFGLGRERPPLSAARARPVPRRRERA